MQKLHLFILIVLVPFFIMSMGPEVPTGDKLPFAILSDDSEDQQNEDKALMNAASSEGYYYIDSDTSELSSEVAEGLFALAREKKWEVVFSLLMANPALAKAHDSRGYSLLYLALRDGKRNPEKKLNAIVAKLFELGVPINAQTEDNMTPLHAAARRGLSCIDFLCENGAQKSLEVRAQTGTYRRLTPLFLAVQNNHIHAAQLLVRYGANIDARDTTNGETPLHVAVRKGLLDMAQLLIDLGANVYAKNYEDEMPSEVQKDMSIDPGHYSAVKLLIEKIQKNKKHNSSYYQLCNSVDWQQEDHLRCSDRRNRSI